MKVSDNYRVEELFHPAYIEQWGLNTCAWAAKKYFSDLVEGQQRVRNFVDAPCVVNNYHWDADYKSGGWEAIKDRADLFINSGIRHLGFPLKKNLSAHYFGLCCDSKQDKYTPLELQNLILDESYQHPNIVRMEDANYTRSWNHFQYGKRALNESITVFKP